MRSWPIRTFALLLIPLLLLLTPAPAGATADLSAPAGATGGFHCGFTDSGGLGCDSGSISRAAQRATTRHGRPSARCSTEALTRAQITAPSPRTSRIRARWTPSRPNASSRQ